MVDLFIYRPPEETEALKRAQLDARQAHPEEFKTEHVPTGETATAGGEQWGEGWGEGAPSTPWGESSTSQWGEPTNEAPVPTPPQTTEPAGWESNSILNPTGWE